MQGVASTVVFGLQGKVLGSILGGGPVGITTAVGLAGAAAQVPEEFKKVTEALKRGEATERDRVLVALFNAGLGATEALGIAPTLAGRGARGLVPGLQRATSEAIEETGQEVFQQFGQNLTRLFTYQPDQDPYEDVGKSGLVAGLSGGAFGAAYSQARAAAELQSGVAKAQALGFPVQTAAVRTGPTVATPPQALPQPQPEPEKAQPEAQPSAPAPSMPGAIVTPFGPIAPPAPSPEFEPVPGMPQLTPLPAFEPPAVPPAAAPIPAAPAAPAEQQPAMAANAAPAAPAPAVPDISELDLSSPEAIAGSLQAALQALAPGAVSAPAAPAAAAVPVAQPAETTSFAAPSIPAPLPAPAAGGGLQLAGMAFPTPDEIKSQPIDQLLKRLNVGQLRNVVAAVNAPAAKNKSGMMQSIMQLMKTRRRNVDAAGSRSATDTAGASYDARARDAIAAQAPKAGAPATMAGKADPRLAQKFNEVIAGNTPRSQWAKALKVDDASLQPLIDSAVAKGLLRLDRNGRVARTAQSKFAASRSASQPAGNVLSVPADQRIARAIELREKAGAKVSAFVRQAATALETARGTPQFAKIFNRIAKAKELSKAEALELARLVGYPPKSKWGKADALASIKDRHLAAEQTNAQRSDVRESQGSVPEGRLPGEVRADEGVGGIEGTPAADRAGSGRDVLDAGGRDGDAAGSAGGVRGAGEGAAAGAGSGQGTGEPRTDPRQAVKPYKPSADDFARIRADAAKKAAEIEAAREDRRTRNYQISDDDGIGKGGPKAKVRANLEALRVLKSMEDEGRTVATEAEKKALVKYVGWGAFAQDVFASYKDEWAKERAQLQNLLTPEEYERAKASTLNAHYTSPEVIKGMWAALEHLGFKGGRVLEPSAGIGHFIGLQPDGLRADSAWSAVELDSVSARITKALYGAADVRQGGFEEQKWPQDFFDLAISNVPFGDYKLHDPEYNKLGLFIHDYFFVKSLDLVRPGGIVAYITSSGTLDKVRDTARREMEKRATFLGAIRLPGGSQGAFKANAGTDVTTDIIFLRKRMPGDPVDVNSEWQTLAEIKTPEGPTKINGYFAKHPEMMLGKMRLVGTMYADKSPVLIGPSTDLDKKIIESGRKLPENAMSPRGETFAETVSEAEIDASVGRDVKEGAFYEKDGKVFRKVVGVGVEQKLNKQDAARVRSFMGIRDVVTDMLAKQASGDTAGMADLRLELNAAYDSFVDQFGPINLTFTTEQKRKDGKVITIKRRPNMRVFADDPDAYTVAAIEVYDEKTSTARKAAIFTEDIIAPYSRPEISGPADALTVSLNETGAVDIPRIAEMLGTSPEAAIEALGDAIYLNPRGEKWEPAARYLSGDVVKKLEEARLAEAAGDKSMARNIKALEDVQPTPLSRAEITVPFGASWLPVEIINQFIAEHVGIRGMKVALNEHTKQWRVVSDGQWSQAANATWATDRVSVPRIVEAALNSAPIQVYDKLSDGSRALNHAETERARAKAQLLKEAFTGQILPGAPAAIGGWVWQDEARAQELEGLYNASFNRIVKEEFDGSHLTFPGLARVVTFPDGTTGTINLTPARTGAVWRIIQNGNTLIDHVVGAGKTWTSIMAVMEMKRLGQIRRPMFVVPNHMLNQFSAEFLQAYPGAKLLVATKESMSAAKRREFAAKAASEKWDGIIITHSAFGRLRMNESAYTEYYQEAIDQLENAKIQAARELGKSDPTVKDLEKAKKRLEAKLAKLTNKERKDYGVTFEELGVDHLTVDEAHCFPHETLIATDCGMLPIGDIVEQRLHVRVKSFDHASGQVVWQPVTQFWKHRRASKKLAVLHTDGYTVTCTTNHQVYVVGRGYIDAGQVSAGDVLRTLPRTLHAEATRDGGKAAALLLSGVQGSGRSADCNEVVRDVRRAVHVPQYGGRQQQQAAVLHWDVCREVAHGTAWQDTTVDGCDARGDAAEVGDGCGVRHADDICLGGTHEVAQSHASICDAAQGVGRAERPDILGSWGQRTADAAATLACGSAERADRVCDLHQAGAWAIPLAAEELQGGCGIAGFEACHRGGWLISPHAEMALPGSQEDRDTECARVVRVEVLEPGSADEPASCCRPDQFVYDIGIEGEHNYFANGVLVHNSFKNLWFPSRHTRVKGISNASESQRATDLFIKIRHLEKSRPGRSTLFLTGTPLSNTMAEVYTMMRYLQYGVLEDYGIAEFDSWAQTFGDIRTKSELAPNGREFRDTTSFGNFVNIPELSALYGKIADTQTAESLNLPRPKLKGGKPTIVETELSDAEDDFMQRLIRDMEALKGKKPEPGAPNFLSLFTKGLQVGTDMRLVDPKAPRNPDGKIAKAIDNVHRIWEAGNADPEAPNQAQLIFLDMGVPGSKAAAAKPGAAAAANEQEALIDEVRRKLAEQESEDAETDGEPAEIVDEDDALAEAMLAGKFNLYEDIKQGLIAKGVPANQIAFIHDAKTDDAKAKLFEQVREGKVRVLIGSSAKMGVGTNVQKRLIALHHVDAPWKPADVEQRDGRILRQGNKNPEIEIFRYVTKRSFDSYRWQILENKAHFIGQFRAGARGVRIAEDIDSPLPEAAELKAAATGDPRIVEHAELSRQVRVLEAQNAAHAGAAVRARQMLGSTKAQIESSKRYVPLYQKDVERVRDLRGENFEIEIEVAGNKKTFTERKAAGELLKKTMLIQAERAGYYGSTRLDLGSVSGFWMTGTMRKTPNGIEVEPVIEGSQEYKGNNGFILNEETPPVGLVQRWERLVQEVPRLADGLKRQIADMEAELPKLEKTSQGSPFPKAAELEDARKRLAALTEALDPKKQQEAQARRADAEQEEDYVKQAMRNLSNTSRTAAGVVDTSASAGKAAQMAEGLTGESAAKAATSNFESVIRGLFRERNAIAQMDPNELADRIDRIALDINAGILKEGALYRQDDSDKYSYTLAESIPEARDQFAAELWERLNDKAADPVETAAWIEWRMNLTDHIYADGVGKTSKAVAYIPLMLADQPLPNYGTDRKAMFKYASDRRYDPAEGGETYLDDKWAKFLAYYRGLMPMADGSPEVQFRDSAAQAATVERELTNAEMEEIGRKAFESQKYMEAVRAAEAQPETMPQEFYPGPDRDEAAFYAWQQARVYSVHGKPVQGWDGAVAATKEKAESYLKDATGEAPANERRAVVLLGLPGSGKSTISSGFAVDTKAAVLNGDDTKEFIPEFAGGLGSMAVHEEASEITKDALSDYLDAGTNLILEKTGSSPGSIRKLINQLRAHDYGVQLVLVDVPKALAMYQVVQRFEKKGRVVPPAYLHDLKTNDVYYTLEGERAADGFTHVERKTPKGAWVFRTLAEPFQGRDIESTIERTSGGIASVVRGGGGAVGRVGGADASLAQGERPGAQADAGDVMPALARVLTDDELRALIEEEIANVDALGEPGQDGQGGLGRNADGARGGEGADRPATGEVSAGRPANSRQSALGRAVRSTFGRLRIAAVDRFLDEYLKPEARAERARQQGFAVEGWHATKRTGLTEVNPFVFGRDFGFHFAIGTPMAANERLEYPGEGASFSWEPPGKKLLRKLGILAPRPLPQSKTDNILPLRVRAQRTLRTPDINRWNDPVRWLEAVNDPVNSREFSDPAAVRKLRNFVANWYAINRQNYEEFGEGFEDFKYHDFGVDLSKVLESMGYDSIVYRNRAEAVGSDSMMVWDAARVRSANDAFDPRAEADSGLLASWPYLYADLEANLEQLMAETARGNEMAALATGFTPEFVAALPQMVSSLYAEAGKVLPAGIAFKVVDNLFVDGQAARASFHTEKAIVKVALSEGYREAVKALMHEAAGHALRDLYTPQEWRVLLDRAAKVGVDQQMGQYGTLYRLMFERRARALGLSGKALRDYVQGKMDEERVAFLAEQWVEGSRFGTEVDGWLKRISDFIQAIRNVFRGLGYTSADRIFAKVQSGEIAARATPQEVAAAAETIFAPEMPTLEGLAGSPAGQALSEAMAAMQGTSVPIAVDAIGFYSQALEAAKALKQAKGTPEQMRAMLRTAGVKEAEIAAVGLDGFLADKTSVSKDEIVRFLQENRVEVKEAKYGPVDRETSDLLDEALIQETFDYEAAKFRAWSIDPDNPTYRETVLHVPNEIPQEKVDAEVARIMADVPEPTKGPNGWVFSFDGQLYGPYDGVFGHRKAARKRRELMEDSAREARVRAAVIEKMDRQSGFRSGHWSEPNIIAHARTSLQKTADGKTVFLIDELQSDWGQKLRDGGVRDEAKIAELKQRIDKNRVELRAALADGEAFARSTIDGPLPFGGDIAIVLEDMLSHTDRYGDEAADRALDLYKRVTDAEMQASLLGAELRTAEAATPGHPLVNTTDQWTTTAFRRLIRQAVEAGADYIALTPASVQYGPPRNFGTKAGMEATYDGIYPRTLGKMLGKMDPEAGKMADMPLKSSVDGREFGAQFHTFPITDRVKDLVLGGQPMFALSKPDTQAFRLPGFDGEVVTQVAEDGSHVRTITVSKDGAPQAAVVLSQTADGAWEASGFDLAPGADKTLLAQILDVVSLELGRPLAPTGLVTPNQALVLMQVNPAALALHTPVADTGVLASPQVLALRAAVRQAQESLPEEVWGPRFQTIMSQQYQMAVAGDDLSTQLDILTAKYFNSPSDPPEMRAAMGREIMRLRNELGPEWMAKYAPDASEIGDVMPALATQAPAAAGQQVQQPIGQGVPRALDDIIADLKTALDMPTTQGLGAIRIVDRANNRRWFFRPKGNVKGQYQSELGVARIRTASDISTIAHEGGHHMERLLGAKLQALMQANVHELAAYGASMRNSASALSEGFAEWFADYVTNPAKAQQMAPTFHDQFEELLDAEAPGLLQNLDLVQLVTMSQAYQQYMQSDEIDQMLADLASHAPVGVIERVGNAVRYVREQASQIGWRKAIQASFMEEIGQDGTISGMMSQVYTAAVDEGHPHYQLVRRFLETADQNKLADKDGRAISLAVHENPYKLLRSVGDAFKTGLRWLQDGMPNYHQMDSGYQVVMPDGRVVKMTSNKAEAEAARMAAGPGAVVRDAKGYRAPSIHQALTKAMGPRWNEKTLALFNGYLVSRRAVEEWKAWEAKQARIQQLTQGLAATKRQLSMARRALAVARQKMGRRTTGKTEGLALLQEFNRELERLTTLEAAQVEIMNEPTVTDLRYENARQRLKLIRRDLNRMEAKWQTEATRYGIADTEAQALGQQIETLEAGIDLAEEGIGKARKELTQLGEKGIQRAPTRHSRQAHERYIARVQAANPQFVEAAKMVYEFVWQSAMHDFQAGRLSQAELDYRATRKHFYVPFARSVPELEAAGVMAQGRAFGGRRAKFAKDKAFTGSQRAIYNPIETIIDQTFHRAAATHLNDAIKAYVALADRVGPGASSLGERVVQDHLIEANDAAFRNLEQQLQALGHSENDAKELVRRIEADFGDTQLLLQFDTTAVGPAKPLNITFWEGGARKYFRINDPELAHMIHNSVNGVGRELSNVFINSMAAPATLLRMGVTTNPTFILRNIIRDAMTSWLITGSIVDPRTWPVVTQARGLYHELFQTDMARMYQEVAGLMGGQNVAALGKVRDKVDVLALKDRGLQISIPAMGVAGLAGGALGFAAMGPAGAAFGAMMGIGLHKGPKRFIETISQFSDMSETATRLGTFTQAYKAAIAYNPNLTPFQAAQEAAFVARDLIDFGRRGSVMMTAARLTPFMNANIQGLDKTTRALLARSDRGNQVSTPKLIGLMAAGAAGGALASGLVAGTAAALAAPVAATALAARVDAARALITPFFKETHGIDLSADDRKALAQSAKTWANLMLLTLGGVALMATYGGGDDDTSAEYGLIREKFKYKAMPVKNPISGEWYAIPKPFEWAIPMNIIEAAIEAQYKGDPRFWEKVRENLIDVTVPPMSPQIVRLYGDIRGNFNSLSKRPIVPDYLKTLPPEERFNAYASEFAIWLSRAVNADPEIKKGVEGVGSFVFGNKFELTPAIVDYAISQSTGYWGKDAQKASNLGFAALRGERPRSEKVQDLPLIGTMVQSFKIDPYRVTQALDSFYEAAGRDGGAYATAANGYKEKLKRYGEQAANQYLATLPEDQRAYALLEASAPKSIRDAHPLNRLKNVVKATGDIEREIVMGRLANTRNPSKLERMTLAPAKADEVRDLMAHIKTIEIHNTLVGLGVKQYAGRKPIDVEPTMRVLEASSPEVAEELRRRYMRTRVGDFTKSMESWGGQQSKLLEKWQEAVEENRAIRRPTRSRSPVLPYENMPGTTRGNGSQPAKQSDNPLDPF